MSQSNSQLLPGMQIYKYSLRQRIGSGSFGEVWVAEDQAVGHEYAIKILKPGTPIHHRLREAQIGHVLDHHNVVKVHQADVSQNHVIIAMDYLPKGPITRLANPSFYLPLPDALRIGIDILRGLEYLHGHDFFHNDIKPENVLIGPHDQGMLTDYGIVGITKDGVPVPATNFYKIHAAPEVINSNSISAQTDLFQAGLTLFRMLVGNNVLMQRFNEMGEKAYYKELSEGKLISPSSFPQYVPSKLKSVILKSINPDTNKRYETALTMRRDLEKMNFPGYWTVENSGDFIGYNGAYSYRYHQAKKNGNKFDINAFKCHNDTGRETRCGRYCHVNLTNAQAKKEISKFVKAVVEGI